MPEKLARLQGFEPRTHGLEGRCSIRLSYRRRVGWITEIEKQSFPHAVTQRRTQPDTRIDAHAV
jgi:hypothetical protein